MGQAPRLLVAVVLPVGSTPTQTALHRPKLVCFEERLQMPDQLNSVLTPDLEQDIHEILAAERARLRREAGLQTPRHFQRPKERAFMADERNKVTILFGGLTWKH